MTGVALVSAILISWMRGDGRYFVAPSLAIVGVSVFYLAELWRRGRQLPVFEVGTLCVAATALYSIMPQLSFLAMGFQWSPWADNRLLQYTFIPREIGLFGWRNFVYLASFIFVYLAVRGRRNVDRIPLKPAPPGLVAAIVILFIGANAYKWLMIVGYGVDLGASYTVLTEVVQRMTKLPRIILQLSLVILATLLVLKQALMLAVIQHWRSVKWRVVLIGALLIQVSIVLVRMGSRSDAVLLMVSFVMLYHRFVRALRLKWLIVAGVLMLGGFLVQGYLRGFLTLQELTLTNTLTTTNEFQSLFATSFDLYQRQRMGTLGPVPWQIHYTDVYLLVPQQLLPFAKIDPSVWYLSILGLSGTEVGLMFGVMSQAILGFDWIELAVRGAVLGLLFALLHRWYVRRAADFWPTLSYLVVSIWTYYTYRATSFWFLHFVVYQFLPVMIAAKTLEYALSRHSRRLT